MSRVDHLSYSAIVTFLRNQVEFQKRYIAKVYDNSKSPSLIVGMAFHKAMEVFYNEGSVNDAVSAGLAEITNVSDYEVDYGKTGSREQMIKEYTQLVNTYFEEAQQFNVVDTEKRMEHTISNVPMVGVIDIAVRSDAGKLQLKDFKTTASYSSPTSDPMDPEFVENYKYLLQGFIYLALAEAEYGEEVESVEFLEIKKAKNRDGSPQTRGFEYDRKSLLEFASTAYSIITNVYAYVNDANSKFFPNPSDYINGMESMQVVANLQEGFDAKNIRTKVNVADRFAPRNITVDVGEDSGSNEDMILRKFIEFGIGGIIGKTNVGASVIQYTFKPNRGIAMSSIARRGDDIAIALKAKSVRIEAPIAGTDLIGIEVPNPERRIVPLEDKHLRPGTTMIPIGETIGGDIHYADLVKMPHLLIAGQTGSGKSVMLNVILTALTKQLGPKDLKLVLIDPKQVELAAYENDKHLMRPIINEPREAAEVLNDLVKIMESRYETLRLAGVRSVDEYEGTMPRIVAVVDEFADLMMTDTSPNIESVDFKALQGNIYAELRMSSTGKITQKLLRDAVNTTIKETAPPSCEDSIVRIAQKARAVGIHLVLATQRPSADVVTGLIKANIPTKIAFAVTTSVNSRIILDEAGAEQLTGYGDMLFQDPSARNLERLQGLYK